MSTHISFNLFLRLGILSIPFVGVNGDFLKLSGHSTADSTFGAQNCAIEWVTKDQFDTNNFDPAGVELWRHPAVNLNITVYVSRALVNFSTSNGQVVHGVIPGKFLNPSVYSGMFYAYNNTQIYHENQPFEVLRAPRGGVSWIPGNCGISSERFILGGYDPMHPSEVYYICRARQKVRDSIFIVTGKLDVRGNCSIALLDKEFVTRDYEVLEVNTYGKEVEGGNIVCY